MIENSYLQVTFSACMPCQCTSTHILVHKYIKNHNSLGCEWPSCHFLSTVQDGYTPLYMASEDGQTEVVDTLLKSNADPNMSTTVRKIYMFSMF